MLEFLIDVGIKKPVANVVMNILEVVLEFSADICLIGGLIGIILYMYGCKKLKNAAMIAWAVNLIVQIIGRVILYA